MCGISGTVLSVPMASGNRTIAERMLLSMRHRGPDDDGLFIDACGNAALAHTRLSILDLSAAGHQPMASADGRYIIAFNGEIYNFRDLRRELTAAGCTFRSQSDTEVILTLYALDGAECVHRLQGMFAFGIWDTREHSLFLARDPLGIKPLYLWEHEGCLVFASEIRAVLAADLGPRRLNLTALFDYLRLGSVREPDTLVEGVSVLPAGHSLLWRDGRSEVTPFWDLTFAPASSADFVADRSEAIKRTRTALEETLNRHFVSDVPVGVFLSGGIDSTAVVALARATGYNDLKTFCISFENPEFDEGSLASRTAHHFETRHTDWRMTAADGSALIEQYLEAMDQPSNDGFNTFCVSKLAHDNGMKVVLSGLGGDELFGGYPSFQQIPRLLRLHRAVSFVPCRKRLGTILAGSSRGNRVRRVGEFLEGEGSVTAAWQAMRGFFTAREARALVGWLVGDANDAVGLSHGDLDNTTQDSQADQISRCELTGYMKNQLLRDSDVMSMAWGLELRVPFADRRLVDTVTRIDGGVRLQQGKQLLRDAVPEIPEWILQQPKRGFRFPFEQWARGSWSSIVSEIEQTSPVSCGAWHRVWSLFVLKHFLNVNRIGISERVAETASRQL